MLPKSGALDGHRRFHQKIGVNKKYLVITLGTVYGFWGRCRLRKQYRSFRRNLNLGCHRLLRFSGGHHGRGGIGVGFALSPINPYTLGVAQISRNSRFSQALDWVVLVLLGLTLLALYICTQ